MEFEFYEDANGETRWRLKAGNHKTVAASGEGYRNRQDAVDIVDKIVAAAREGKISIRFEEK